MPKQKSSFYSQYESEYKARIKLERQSAMDYSKENSTHKNNKRKIKRRKKKVKKAAIKSNSNTQKIVVDKPVNKENSASSSQMQIQLQQYKENAEVNSNDEITECKSQYEFHSETEFESDEDCEMYMDEISGEYEDQGAEEENECQNEIHAASNCAYHDSDYSLSSLSDTFFYENFPSKSRVNSCKQSVVRGEYDDDNDVQYSCLSFKLLQLNDG